MQDIYVKEFVKLASSARADTGIELPASVEHYVVCLLAVHVDKPDFLPHSTFGESLLTMKPSTAKLLGDTCLFVTSVFPEYGINERYYTDIGRTAYTSIDRELFQVIGVHFDTVKTFTRSVVRGNHPKLIFD